MATKKRSSRKSAPAVVFGPASLVRIPPASERSPAAAAPSAAELKTTRVKRLRCPKCLQRAADTEVQIGFVTLKVCSDCAAPAENALKMVSAGLEFFESLKRFL